MHRASMLSYGPHFVGGERNLSTKEGRCSGGMFCLLALPTKARILCLDSI